MKRTRISTSIYVTSIALALSVAPLVAQEDSVRRTATPPTGTGVFGTLALGAASPGIGGVLSLSVHASGNAFVFRTSGASAFELFSPSDLAEDYAFLFGRTRERARGWVRAGVGPALVHVVRYGRGYDCFLFVCSYDEVESYHPGLALQAEAVWTPARVLGLGVTGFANLNSEMPYAGIAVGLHVGRVRRS